MKIIPEHNDLILYTVASDGQGNKIWEYGKVQAVIGENIYLGSGLVIPVASTLPSMENLREVMDKVTEARCSGAKVYGHTNEGTEAAA